MYGGWYKLLICLIFKIILMICGIMFVLWYVLVKLRILEVCSGWLLWFFYVVCIFKDLIR